jgi:Uma2 family endonuclease
MSIATESELQHRHHPTSVENEVQPLSWPIVFPLDAQIKVSLTDFQRLCSLNQETRLERSAEGDLILMPPESSWSGHRNSKISQYLGLWADQHGGFEFGSSAGFILPNGACRSPDSSWISLDRWNSLSADDRSGFARICPDFVVELRSPSDSLTTLQSKMQEYMANGSKLGWLIDPSTKTVMIYRLGQESPESLINPPQLSGETILPGFILILSVIFKEPG